jgi:hypothetical protein
LTRKAIKDLQRLQSTGSIKVPERLFKPLSSTQDGEKFLHTIHLRHYAHLWRSRLDLGGGSSLRLIWTKNREDGSIRFLYADQRSDDTYALDLNTLPQEPVYCWHGETGVEWELFLNNTYKLSPVLTRHQRWTSQQVGQENYSMLHGKPQRVGFFAHITQSPPGTGKTITAALRARELYDSGWNVIFLVPQSLLKDVQSFHCIQSIPSDQGQGFFCGTFQEWIVQSSPQLADQVLSPQEELAILQDFARRKDQSSSSHKLGSIEPRDVILFQSFVLKSDASFSKNQVYQDNQDRIESLQSIPIHWWTQKLSQQGKQSRSDLAQRLGQNWTDQKLIDIPDASKVGTILIIDESQDYLLDELKAIITLCRTWHRAGHATHLWLLGDLNQRIMPVDFDWGALHLVPSEEPEWPCFRNSSHILKFSNLFLHPVQKKSQEMGVHFPPPPTDPSRSYELGEPVKLIRYSSKAKAEQFLDQLVESMGSRSHEIEKNRSLIYKLVSRIKVLKADSCQSMHHDELEFLNVHDVKGREFDSCVVFNVFDISGTEPTSEDWWQWYTLLTRTRSRLLIVVTESQYQTIVRSIPELPSECEQIDGQDADLVATAIQWIQAEHNDLEFSLQERALVQRYLREALQLEYPLIYWDSYEVLDRIHIQGNERTKFEYELLCLLKQYPREVLKSELDLFRKNSKNNLIPCLLLRALGESWQAADSVEFLRSTNPSEYTRIIQSIASDLEAINLVVESARLQFQKLQTPYPQHLPYPEIAEVSGNILIALAQIYSSKLQIR